MTQGDRTARPAPARPAGFTLVEILVVVAVIGILMALLMGVSKEVITQSYIRSTKLKLATLRDTTIQYKDKFRAYPNGDIHTLISELGKLHDVESLVGKDYYVGGTIVDAWKNEIKYCYSPSGSVEAMYNDLFLQNNRTPIFVSAGPDGAFNYTDDVTIPEKSN